MHRDHLRLACGALLLVLVTAAHLLGGVAACVAEDLPPMRSERPPFFSADVVISLDSEGHPALGVTVTVPYGELQWIKITRPGGLVRYGAGALLTVVFQPTRGSELHGGNWEHRLVVPTFGATRSPNATLVETRTFQVPPGGYRCKVIVQDLNGGSQSVAEQSVDVPDYTKVQVGFADLELGLVDSTGAFSAVPTRVYGLEVVRLAARASLFDRRPGSWPRRYPFRYKITDDLGEPLVSGTAEVTANQSAERVIVHPTPTPLFLGSYMLQIELTEGKSHWRVERSFEVDESGPPRGREFERMLEPLSYIATAEEIERLRALPQDQQELGWQEFWRRRDPTPDTPRNEAMLEFFRRVRHAQQHFQGFGPGWRSDMGRVYIKYGPPDQTETRPATSTSPQLEVWYYNNPYRRFVFADREGFGRYVLISPDAE